MWEELNQILENLIQGAQKLSELNPGAIWALLALVEFLILVFMIQRNSKIQEKALDVRLADAEANIEIANAVERLANEIRVISDKVKGGVS